MAIWQRWRERIRRFVEDERTLKGLASKDAVAREKAERSLRDRGGDPVEFALACVAHSNRLSLRTAISYVAAIVIVALIGVRAVFIADSHTREIYQLYAAIAQFTAGMLYLFGQSYVMRRRQRIKELASYLDDKRLLGVLITSLTGDESEKAKAVRPLVTSLLERLTPEDRGLLNDTQRAELRQELTSGGGALTYAILCALEKIGNAKDLPRVRELAERSYDPAIMTAAQRCAEVLEARVIAEKQGRTLLRPATVPEAGVLLRPAHGASETPAEQLLRVSGRPRPNRGRAEVRP